MATTMAALQPAAAAAVAVAARRQWPFASNALLNHFQLSSNDLGAGLRLCFKGHDWYTPYVRPGSVAQPKCPTYKWTVHRDGAQPGVIAGTIQLRLGDCEDLRTLAGHVGYWIHPDYRGRRIALAALRPVLNLGISWHGLSPLVITCDQPNLASRRTCELAGGALVGTVPVPADNPQHSLAAAAGEHHRQQLKCVYHFYACRTERS